MDACCRYSSGRSLENADQAVPEAELDQVLLPMYPTMDQKEKSLVAFLASP